MKFKVVATITKKTEAIYEQVAVLVTPAKPATVTLTMTKKQACTLVTVLDACGGSTSTRRGDCDAIGQSINGLGIYGSGYNDPHKKGSIMFDK
jgi:hypothetical protein